MLPLLAGTGLGAAVIAMFGLFIALAGPAAWVVLGVAIAFLVASLRFNLMVWNAEQDSCLLNGVGSGLAALLIAAAEMFFARIAMLLYRDAKVTTGKDAILNGINQLIGALFGITTPWFTTTSIPNCWNNNI